MFNKLWKRIHQWLPFNVSGDSPLSESASEQNQWNTATDEAAQSPESLKNDAACDHRKSCTPDDISHEKEDIQCRICYGDHSDADPLMSPCECSGSMTYIHRSCLRTWISTRLQSGSTLGAATRCEICTKTFDSVANNQQVFEVYTTYFNNIGGRLRTIEWEVILNVRPHTPDT